MSHNQLSLRQFLDSSLRNSYIRYRDLHVYVRKGKRYINGKVVNLLELASITNLKRPNNLKINPSITSTGQFREFDSLLKTLAVEYGFDGVFVENVLNEFLPAKLLSCDYYQVNLSDITPCFCWQPPPKE